MRRLLARHDRDRARRGSVRTDRRLCRLCARGHRGGADTASRAGHAPGPGGRVRAFPSGRGRVWPLPPASGPGVFRSRPRRRLRAECRHAIAPDRHPSHGCHTSAHRQRAARGDRRLRRRRLLSPRHAATPCGSIRRHRLEHRHCRGAELGLARPRWVSTWSNCLSGTTSTTPRRSTGWCRRPPKAMSRRGRDTPSQRSACQGPSIRLVLHDGNWSCGGLADIDARLSGRMKVSAERNAPGVSGDTQARGGRPGARPPIGWIARQTLSAGSHSRSMNDQVFSARAILAGRAPTDMPVTVGGRVCARQPYWHAHALG